MELPLVFVLVNVVLVNAYVNLNMDNRNPAFDSNIYEDVLDPELCTQQLEYISNDTKLRTSFLEAGLRLPRSMSMGNLLDMGNYHQCLGISEDDMNIQGKYCMIKIPIDVNSQLDIPERSEFKPNMLQMNKDKARALKEYDALVRGVRVTITEDHNGMRAGVSDIAGMSSFRLAVCIPKPCSTQQAISSLLFNITQVGFQYVDDFCRIPNDKPWAPADYVAIVIFSIIGLLTLLSTSYDLWHVFIAKRNPKAASPLWKSFSVYTNARRLTTFTSNPGALECVDGIRAIAMLWVIVGHTFVTLPSWINTLDVVDWLRSFRSLWITGAPITVDTFFMLSGLLVVYTTAGKLTKMKLLKNLHLFYLNRILRMFPLLAAAILLEASIFFRISDGPMWNSVASNTNNCRTYWWTNLIYLQNYLASSNMCLPHTWYLAIDMQLHIISPIVIFWLLGGRRTAWAALTAALLISITAATTYNFIKEFPGSMVVFARIADIGYYSKYYYFNTLTRASPFFVGMVFGYLLHICRGRKIEMPKVLVVFLWIGAFALTSAAMYATHPMKDIKFDNQTFESLVNSFQRPMWAMALGWMVFACVQGYGGPINWFLSLRVWKLPSRISYAMYLFHFPIMYVIAGTAIAPVFFTEKYAIYQFLSQLVITFVVSFLLTLLIDSPFSTLVKLALGGGPRKPQKVELDATPKTFEEVSPDMRENLHGQGVYNEGYCETEVERKKELYTNF